MSRMRTAIKESAMGPAQINEMAGVQSYCFDQDFIGFSGHFPDYPILPAVLQVLLAQLLAEEIIGFPLSVGSLNRAKFLQQLRPDDHIEVRLNCLERGEVWRCSCELQVGGSCAASFVLILEGPIRTN